MPRGSETMDMPGRQKAPPRPTARRTARLQDLQRRLAYPPGLPILEKRREIVEAIRRHQVVIVTGETGSGKTTQLPKMCVEAGRGSRGIIGCTQPRRVAAVTVARRVSEELGEPLPGAVSYKIRFEERSSLQSVIKIMTDGVLLMETQRDRLLRAYDTLIVDEAHERSLNIDFLLGVLRGLLPRRADLKIVITSATLDTETFARAFPGAPVIEVSGRMYPVEVRYRPPGGGDPLEGSPVEAAVEAVEDLFRARAQGDVLVFLPTERDIRETCALLAGRLGPGRDILPLYARLTWENQKRVFEPSSRGKIVVATNVAETSVTIPGIRYVVDTGLARIAQYNPRNRTAGLPVRPISRSSADQRKGRCGRVRDGICIRLYDEEDYLGRPLFTPPEILRANLAGVILRMLFLGLGDIDSFPFVDRPSPRGIRDAMALLAELDAVVRPAGDKGEDAGPVRLTALGRRMARLPLDPRLSRTLFAAAEEGCLPEALVVVAALSIQDPRERPADKEALADAAHLPFRAPASDFLTYVNLWEAYRKQRNPPGSRSQARKFCRDHFLSFRRMEEWEDVHDQIRDLLAEEAGTAFRDDAPRLDAARLSEGLHRAVLAGFLSHIALRKEKNLYQAARGREVMLFPGSGLFHHGGTWIVAAELVETSRLFARTVARVEPSWIEDVAGDLCRRRYFDPHWDRGRGQVVAWEEVRLFGLVLVEKRLVAYHRIDPAEAGRIFVRQALVSGEMDVPLAFQRHNDGVVASVVSLENKLRRRDLLADPEVLAAFYDERLPGVWSLQGLKKAIREQGSDAFLRITEQDVLARLVDPCEAAAYPDAVDLSGTSCACTYAFSPGAADDGATVRLPLSAVARITPEVAERLVPGLVPERIAALLRGLPKSYRRRLQPMQSAISAAVTALGDSASPLVPALQAFVRRGYGIDIPPAVLESIPLPDHLKLRMAVLGETGEELAASRDVRDLQEGLLGEVSGALFAEARAAWEKHGLTAWDFGDLPETLTFSTRAGLPLLAFPALEPAGEAVNLRLFPTRFEADALHPRGVAQLFCLHFAERMRHLRKGLAFPDPGKGTLALFGSAKALVQRLADKVVADLFRRDIRTREAFEGHAASVALQILPRGQAVLSFSLPVFRALDDAAATLERLAAANRGNGPVREFLAEMHGELRRLAPPDFLLAHPEERLSHLPRYLKALALRVERGVSHLEKAREREKTLRAAQERLTRLREGLSPSSSLEKRLAVEDFAWMIEELKVSLFAQELRTPSPVSLQRLAKKGEEIAGMF